MFNQLIGKIGGVDVWLIASLLIFGIFFIGVSFYIWGLKKSYINNMRNMPLECNENRSV